MGSTRLDVEMQAEAVLQSGEEALVSGCASWEWIWALGGLSLLLLLGLLTTAACLGGQSKLLLLVVQGVGVQSPFSQQAN